ncbi:hypothetical protein [Pseudalkalibacillus berkeleyi]|uniref:Uncharacterized protein n=1 Tax=Pseudalkalibacillus berkeleyi TaxID=1069813 RepID=A0ABS9H1W5_9BACL|nr:hypothetical protein [Pseudalkalibacillus berkeleyi]MCF6137909.1 hypothetical protein [Pseudalkalibacillus berkeleyi]
MENVLEFIFLIIQILIILYVIFSLAVMNDKLNKLMKQFEIDEDSLNRVSNEEIERELEAKMEHEKE